MLRPGRDKPNPYFSYESQGGIPGAALRGDPRFQKLCEEKKL